MVKGKKGNLLKKRSNMVLEYGMDGTGKKLSLIRVVERCKNGGYR